MALVIVVGVVSRLRRHPARPGRVRSKPGPGPLRDQLRIVAGARDFRLLLVTFVVQALATGCMLAGVDYLATDVLDRKGATTVLFVCFVGPALLLTPAWSALGARIGKKQGYLASSVDPRGRRAPGRAGPLGAVRPRRRGGRTGRGRVRRLPGLPARDAARRGGRRRAPDRELAGRRLHRRLDRRRDARPRARPGLFALVLAVGGYRSSTDGDVAQPESAQTAITLGFSVLPALLVVLSLRVARALHPRLRPGRREPDRSHGMTDALERLKALQAADLPVHGGRTLAYVYDSGLPDVDRIGREAVAAYAGSNGLDPTAFPSLLRMENDLVGFALGLLDGPDTAVGTVTSGGTESVLLAVQAARDAHPDVTEPRMVLPSTAHAAFHKAAHYFGVEPVLVPVGADFTRRRRGDRGGGRRGSRPDRAGGRERAVVRARRRRPGHRARGPGRGSRDPVPRRRVHRRLGAAVRRAARPRRDPVDVRGGGGHLDLGRPAQVRLRTQGHLAAAAPDAGAAEAAVLRVGGLAGLHDAELDDAVDQVGRAPGRRLGRGRVAG